MTTRIEYEHGTDINVIKACLNGNAPDLIAMGGEHSVEILQVTEESCTVIASFYLGVRATTVAWSPRTVSPKQSDTWLLELAVAGEDLNLRLLKKDFEDDDENIFIFGGGLSGHRKKVNELTWCGGFGEESFRFLASVSDEKVLLFWDLASQQSPLASPTPASKQMSLSALPRSPSPTSGGQLIPFAVSYAHPLHSVVSHPTSSKDLVVSDSQGSVFVVDWRGDEDPTERYRGLSVAQLIDPRALADARTGMQTVWGGSVSWNQVDSNLIGATYGSRYSIWDLRHLQGGKPLHSGTAFQNGTHRFRWSPNSPTLFALSSHSPLEDAVILLQDTRFAKLDPRRIVLRPKPHRVRDFDWIKGNGANGPRIVAAVGRRIMVIDVGGEFQ